MQGVKPERENNLKMHFGQNMICTSSRIVLDLKEDRENNLLEIKYCVFRD